MSDTLIIVSEGATAKDAVAPMAKVETRQYRVLAEYGIFKGGKHTSKDNIATLEVNAGRRLAAMGDVEEVQ